MSERLGLTDEEVAWLRANMDSNQDAMRLVKQYQMVVICPRDHGARGIFAAMLDEFRAWRRADQAEAQS